MFVKFSLLFIIKKILKLFLYVYVRVISVGGIFEDVKFIIIYN